MTIRIERLDSTNPVASTISLWAMGIDTRFLTWDYHINLHAIILWDERFNWISSYQWRMENSIRIWSDKEIALCNIFLIIINYYIWKLIK